MAEQGLAKALSIKNSNIKCNIGVRVSQVLQNLKGLLSEHEAYTVVLLSNGYSLLEISDIMHRSVNTLNKTIKNIKRKFNVNTTNELTYWLAQIELGKIRIKKSNCFDYS